MPTDINTSQHGNQLTISVSGRFDFSILQQFRDAYSTDAVGNISAIQIDLSKTEHMDSSGMGLLLSMKKDLALDSGAVSLVKCRPHVKDALLAARMDNLFRIE